MDGISCDACGAGLLIESEVRYLVKIEVYAAYDPLELTGQDLARDHRADMGHLIESMKGMDPRELEDQVYRKFQFDLCPACQKEYLKNPLRFTPPRGGRQES